MKILRISIIALLLMWLGISGASGAVIGLYDWGFNLDGTVYSKIDGGNFPGDLPGSVDASGFNFTTGLGTIEIALGPGAHSVDFFVDHEIDQTINTYFNETGSATGTAATGQSWEIDEPGWGSNQNNGTGGTQYFGDIFINFWGSTLDNQIFYDDFDGQSLNDPDDVSMALGWNSDFPVESTIKYLLSETAPTSGFYLTHTDPDSNASIYFTSSIHPVPEPTTLLLLGIGLVGLAGMGRKKFRKLS
jgi:hypothetical protein